MKRIWLIGGTQESAKLAIELIQAQLPCIVTVTTEAARSLYPSSPLLQVWIERFNATQLPTFLQAHSIQAILDASHPYATEISQLAIDTANHLHLPYLRYERPSLETTPLHPHTSTPSLLPLHPLHLPHLNTLLTTNYLAGERVLLTLGYRTLHLFQPWHDRATLFARILPSTTALDAALAAGFTPDRLIALRPPISIDLEKALWQQWQISMVVTKASGTAGGEDVKRQVAAELGVKLVILDRPDLSYPQQTSDLQVAVKFCQHHLL